LWRIKSQSGTRGKASISVGYPDGRSVILLGVAVLFCEE